jgi:hypothetical protein
MINRFLPKAANFKHVLFINDFDPSLKGNNFDISVGSYRSLDLRAEPFNLLAEELFRYRSTHLIKQVLHIEHEVP